MALEALGQLLNLPNIFHFLFLSGPCAAASSKVGAIMSNEIVNSSESWRAINDPRIGSTQIEWGEFMIKLGARACIVATDTSLSDKTARKLWFEINQRISPPGQQPGDLMWYLKPTVRRFHAAMILALYGECQRSMPSYAAFAHAYYHYARMTASGSDRKTWMNDPAMRSSDQNYLIPYSRGRFLCNVYTDELDASGNRLCQLKVKRCKKCSSLFLSTALEASQVCPNCG
jgi:hypothetical protein